MNNISTEIREAVRAADEAVYHAQLQNDPSYYEHSQKAIFHAEYLINQWKNSEHENTPPEIHHAEEMLRHVKETLVAISSLE